MRKRLSGRPDKALVEDDAFYNSVIQIKKGKEEYVQNKLQNEEQKM